MVVSWWMPSSLDPKECLLFRGEIADYETTHLLRADVIFGF
jgi:hypothetical protein